MALQGTKACLGWDKEPRGGSHACTAVVDLWLQLLQRALHLSHKLPSGPADSLLPRQGSLGEGSLDPALDIQSQVALLVSSYQASLQELMTQLLVHWKVRRTSNCLSPKTVLSQQRDSGDERKVKSCFVVSKTSVFGQFMCSQSALKTAEHSPLHTLAQHQTNACCCNPDPYCVSHTLQGITLS